MKEFILLLIIPFLSFSQVNYETQIQPILNANCIECHQGNAGYFGGLTLTSYEELMEGGYTEGGIISTGLLEEYITTGYMPAYGSGNQLSNEEINLIVQWISEGALGDCIDGDLDSDGICDEIDNCIGTWITDVTTGDCNLFTSQGADVCSSYSGCEWIYSWGGWVAGGSSDCLGSYQLDNSYCDELELLISGCIDESACNYDELATDDDGSCEYPNLGYDCNGNCVEDEDNDGICDEIDDCIGTWIFDITTGNCTDFTSEGSDVCNSYSGCEWTISDVWGGWEVGQSSDCLGGYEIDNSYCDELDGCIGEYDECGICNGNGPAPYYDCDGNCINDLDSDDICDELDDCVGEYDECGICNGNGPAPYYDCNGNCISDIDIDEVCDELDNCPEDYNPNQEDNNIDGVGDACDGIGLNEGNIERKLIKVVDILGREAAKNKDFLLLIYDDGSVEKKYVIE